MIDYIICLDVFQAKHLVIPIGITIDDIGTKSL